MLVSQVFIIAYNSQYNCASYLAPSPFYRYWNEAQKRQVTELVLLGHSSSDASILSKLIFF